MGVKNFYVRINQLKNGYSVSVSWEETKDNGETEYKDEEWAYQTLDEAFFKAREVMEKIK